MSTKDITIKSNEALLKFIDDNKIKKALIGNGFSLSHPEYGKKIKFDIDCIIDNIKEIRKEVLQITLQEDSLQCPEKSLKGLRLFYTQCVLQHYIKAIIDNENEISGSYKKYMDFDDNPWHCIDFLNKIDNVFTTNYDPILYFEILRHLGYAQSKLDIFYPTKEIKSFIDGFQGDKFITQNKITCSLSRGTKKVYYLHGSWFIQGDDKNDKILRKVSFADGSNDTIDTLFNWNKRKLPYLIFEDDSRIKELRIKDSPYFTHCFEQLQKEPDTPILIFGMSFNLDDYLVDALKVYTNLEDEENEENEDNSKLYITYLKDEDKKSIQAKLAQKNLKEENITYIQIEPDVIWSKNQSKDV